LSGAFEEPFGGVGSLGDERGRWRESVGTAFAGILVDADAKSDLVGTNGQVVEVFAGALLFDGLTGVLAVRTQCEFVLGREREEDSFLERILVHVGDAEVRELEELSPEEELSGGVHGD
jgi:hypothetical protein